MNENVLKLKRLEEMLKGHDWYFQYSDDHSVWSRANEVQKSIGYLMAELKREGFEKEASELYLQYRPKNA